MKSKRAILFSAFSLLAAVVLTGQVPNTELFLFDLTQDDTSGWHIHNPKYLSGFNKGGYTNQPAFITNDIIYVSVQMDTSTQNDIFALHLDNDQIEQVTTTSESEFSPTLHPDGTSFTCIRQVLGVEVNQQLFKYPLDRSSNGKSTFPEIRNIGYHTWINETEAALFLVTEPNKLSWADLETQDNTILASKIGRALRTTPEGKLAYVHKYNDKFWYLKTLSGKRVDSQIVGQMPAGEEDFTISSEGVYFCGKGSILMYLDPSKGDQWRPIANLALFGVTDITRLAISNDHKIAVVSNNSTKR